MVKRLRAACCGWCVVLSLGMGAGLATAQTVRFEAGDQDRHGTPVEFVLPESAARFEAPVLIPPDGGTPLPVQWIDHSARSAAVMVTDLPKGTSRDYRIASRTKEATPPVCEARRDENTITLLVRGRPVLQYNTSVVQPPEGVDPVFARSGHIHPVWTPAGRVVTSEFPADHLHQHGIFRAWVNTTFEGRKVDFWNQKARTGHVEHIEIREMQSGDVFCEFTAELKHSDLTAPGGSKPVLRELWTVRTWNIGDGFLIDIESRQTCVAESPLILNEYHYGGMAFRGTDQWLLKPKERALTGLEPIDADTIVEVTSEGKDRIEGNHTRPRWVLAGGPIDGEPASVVAMGHSRNFRAPEPVRLHPDKPYFVFTPVALGEYQLDPGVEHVARYRFAVSDHAPDTGRAERIWKDYGAGPAVTVK